MGCPGIYYKRALQYFAHALAYEDNKKIAEELSKEKSEEKLEDFILKKKKVYDEREFYYDAGRTSQQVVNEANEEGCDAFNACIGGLGMFVDFIGLEDEN